MSAIEVEQELRGLLAETSQLDVSELGVEADLVRELGLDSLAGLRVLAAVEKRFDVRFPDEKLGDFRTMRRILDFIVARNEESAP